MDGNIDLHTDTDSGADAPVISDEAGTYPDITDGGSSGNDDTDTSVDTPDDYTEDDLPETDTGIESITDSVTDSTLKDSADIIDGGSDEEAEPGTDALEDSGNYSFDYDILYWIKDILNDQSEDIHSFSACTVSGNSISVSFDDNSSALIQKNTDVHNEALTALNSLYGLVMLVFITLVFDILHRFAKRIIKNFIRGDDKNGTNT